MEYTASAMAKLALISVRTLRHYDQIGLLSPKVRMVNGRRLYSSEEACRLCEIVTFKQFGFSLEEIKTIFAGKKYDKSGVLEKKKKEVEKEIFRLQRTIRAIDLSIRCYKNYKGDQKEAVKQFAELMTWAKEFEQMTAERFGPEVIERAEEKRASMTQEEIEAAKDWGVQMMNRTLKLIEEGLAPDSKESQKLMQECFDWTSEFYPMTEETYLKGRDVVIEQRAIYEAYHKKMPEYLYEAMTVFAKRHFG